MASKSTSTSNTHMFQFLNSFYSKLQQGKTQEHLIYLLLLSPETGGGEAGDQIVTGAQ